MPNQKVTEPIAAIPLPSADYLAYRFDTQDSAIKEIKDQQKQNFDALNHKLDYMVETFITRNEFSEARNEGGKEHEALWKAIKAIKDSFRWWATWIVGAIAAIGAIGYLITVLIRGR